MTAPARHGRTRALDPAETGRLRTAAAAVPTAAPPWTDTKRALFATRDNLILDLYEDGVSVPDLAAALGGLLGLQSLHLSLRKARNAGHGTGTRRYQPRAVRPGRPRLNAADVQELQALFARIPAAPSGYTQRTGPEADALHARLISLRDSNIAMADAARALGISREAVGQRLAIAG